MIDDKRFKDIKKYHYIYRITNKMNSKYYIGIHSTNDIADGYMGSGTHLKSAQQKYGIQNFTKEIIEFFHSREELVMSEMSIVTEDIVNDLLAYNKVIGGGGTGKLNHIGTKCLIECKEYNSFKSASVDTGYSSDIIQRMHIGGFNRYNDYQTYIKESNTAYIKCIINDVEYNSITEASNVTGVSYQTIRRMIDANVTTVDEYNKLSGKNRSSAQIGTKCVINGVEYNSIASASKQTSITECVISNMIKNRVSDYTEYQRLHGKIYRKKNIGSPTPCIINNRNYKSLTEASVSTGLSIDIIKRMIEVNVLTYSDYELYKSTKRKSSYKLNARNNKKCVVNNKTYNSITEASSDTQISKYEIGIMRDNNITTYKEYNDIKNIDKTNVMCDIAGKQYKSIAEASRNTNISRHKIRRMINAGIDTYTEYENWLNNKK